MKTVVIDLLAHSDCYYDLSDSSVTLTVMSRIGEKQYADLYWCYSFSIGFKDKPIRFGGTNRSIGSRFMTAYNKEKGIEIHLYEQ